MKKSILFTLCLACLFLASCMNSTFALRSVIYMNEQKATTDGSITMMPKTGASSVEAPKTTNDSYKPTTNANANVANEAQEVNSQN